MNQAQPKGDKLHESKKNEKKENGNQAELTIRATTSKTQQIMNLRFS